MAALRGAVAGADPHDVAVLVADDLHLDVARPREVALDVDLVATEERLRLALGAVHRLLHLVGAVHHLHAAAAAAERGLDRHRLAVLVAELEDLVADAGELGGAGHDRRAAAQRGLAAELTLSPISSMASGGGPMNVDAHAR